MTEIVREEAQKAGVLLNDVYLHMKDMDKTVILEEDGVHLTKEGQAKMKKIEDCLNCGLCKSKCPYGLDTPNLLRRNYEDYKTFLK